MRPPRLGCVRLSRARGFPQSGGGRSRLRVRRARHAAAGRASRYARRRTWVIIFDSTDWYPASSGHWLWPVIWRPPRCPTTIPRKRQWPMRNLFTRRLLVAATIFFGARVGYLFIVFTTRFRYQARARSPTRTPRTGENIYYAFATC